MGLIHIIRNYHKSVVKFYSIKGINNVEMLTGSVLNVIKMTQSQFSKLTQTDGVNFQRGQMLLLLLRKTFITTIVFELNDKKYILCWRDIQL